MTLIKCSPLTLKYVTTPAAVIGNTANIASSLEPEKKASGSKAIVTKQAILLIKERM